jgi:hypothetical protein
VGARAWQPKRERDHPESSRDPSSRFHPFPSRGNIRAALGRLRASQSNESRTLEAYSLVGRGQTCGVLLKDHRVSAQHACLKYAPTGWVLRDLGSVNGTWVNGHRLAPGADVEVRAGDAIAFGKADLVWRLEDASPPEPMALALASGEAAVLSDGVILLPSGENPAASIFRGADGGWTLESPDHVRAIEPGDVVEVNGTSYRFSCPNEWQATAKIQRVRLVSESVLYFDVSDDEEHVSLTVEFDGERMPFGRSNAYYFLLTLARLRNAEQRAQRETEAGWAHREELMNMLKCSEQQLNVWVFRIRSKFASKEFLDYAAIVERRDGTGQLRIGVPRNVIRDGSKSPLGPAGSGLK